MFIAQYYADTRKKRDKVIALAELLGCEYRTMENIITLQVRDKETLTKLKWSELPPYSVQ